MEGNPESERFVQVAQAEDPFTADALEAVLKAAGMSVFRSDHPGTSGVEALGTGWVLLAQLSSQVQFRLVEEAPEAERAAEDEERESEGSKPGTGR